MDRFYLGKLVDDLNASIGDVLDAALPLHFFMALDREVAVGEANFKVLRYLYSIDDECPVERLLGVRDKIETVCRRFSGSDYECQAHFGSDDWVPVASDGFRMVLHFYQLEHGIDGMGNKVRVAGMLDDPENQEQQLPTWLSYDQGLTRAHLEDQIMAFCQSYISRHFDHLFQIRDFEAAFWRVINLACCLYDKETYEDLVVELPARFHKPLMQIPNEWQALRQKEYAFSKEDFARCSRDSLRFCQHLMEMEGAL